MLDRISLNLLCVALLCQGCAAGNPLLKSSGVETPQKKIESPSDQSTAKGIPNTETDQAMKVYRDPVTGEFTAPPPEAKVPAVPLTIRESVSTAPTPTMKETAVEGGGVKLNLEGRFRSHVTATKDAEGKIVIHCNDKLPSGNDQ